MHIPYAGVVAPLLLLILPAGCGGGSDSGDGAAQSTQTAVSYYIDAASGDDTHAGTTSSTAWKTLAQLQTANLTPPVTVYLKRGSVWHESLEIPVSKITIDSYGSGALPQLDGSAVVDGWTSIGGGLYSTTLTLSSGEALGNLSQDAGMLHFLPWKTDSANTFAGAASDNFSFDYSTGMLYIKPASDPVAHVYRASVLLRGIYAANRQDVALHNLDVRRFSLHGVEFKDCTRCTVSDSSIMRVGGAVIGANSATPPDYLYAGNGIEFANNSSDGEISNTMVGDIFDSGITVQTYASNRTASSIRIDSVDVQRCGFAGLEISVLAGQSGNTGSVIDNVSVTAATVSDSGQGWSGRRYGTQGHGIRVLADSGAGSISNISITASSISGAAGDGVYVGGDSGVLRLVRTTLQQNAGHGITVADPAATSLGLQAQASIIARNGDYGVLYNAPFAAGLWMHQNTLHANNAINLAILAQSGTADIRNNLFFSEAAMTHLYAQATLANAEINHNCYNDLANLFGYNGVAYSTVQDFNAATGFENNGRGDGVTGLSDPANGNYRLLATSDCRGLGDPATGVMLDNDGSAFANPPSSGAFEFK